MLKSLFLCILLNGNYRLKAKRRKTKVIQRVSMHAFLDSLSLNSKVLMERDQYLAFLTTQIDQSSPAVFVPTQTVESTGKGFKTSFISITSLTGVGVKLFYDDQLLVIFIPWKLLCNTE